MIRATALVLLAALPAHAASARSKAAKPTPPAPPVAGESEAARTIAKMAFPLLSWKPPEVGKQVRRELLENGLVVYLMEDRRLPLVNLQLMLPAGEVSEPASKPGVSELVGNVARTGGAGSRAPDALNRELDFLAARLETGGGTESASASLDAPSENLDAALPLFADVVLRPSFAADKVELARDRIRERIRRRNDSPGGILAREFSRIVYGNHVYGRTLEWAEIKRLTRDDLRSFHAAAWRPDGALLGVAGDFAAEEMLGKIRSAFGGWKKGSTPRATPAPVGSASAPMVRVLSKDIGQTNVQVGHLGVKFGDPDMYAIALMNHVLGGGGFGSRLTSRVRSDEGLAYSVYSRFGTDSRDLGLFTAGCQTKAATSGKAAALIVEEIRRMRDGGATEKEIANAKDAFVNRFVFRFTSADRVLGELMSLEYYDRPRDYLATYLEKIRAVSVSDVMRAAERCLKPGELTILAVGKADVLADQLAPLGKVEVVEIAEPNVD